MNIKSFVSFIAVFCVAALFFQGCSTQKDTLLNKVYHQVNTKYNGLYYAKEHLNDGLKKINATHEDNYNDILSINKLGSLKSIQSAKNSLDQAIQKATRAIQGHSMDIGGEEKNKFIDDSYIIIGRAKFYKQEYSQAINTFNYIYRKTNNIETQMEALVWSTICHAKLENKEAVRNNINILNEDFYLKPEQQSVIYELQAEQAIKEEYYLEAIQNLKKSILNSRNKEKNTRMYYVLGQLSIKTNNYSEALDYFTKVIKLSSSYELIFQAQLNRAKAYHPDNQTIDLQKELEEMLNDKKNQEYRDQIHFAIAGINIKNGDTISAVSSIKKSLNEALFNNEQKIRSHYFLAQIFWDNKEYMGAYSHSDSAFQIIDEKYSDYENIKSMRRSSGKIAKQYNIINYNDSIVALAGMPEKERNMVIDAHISNLKNLEELQKRKNNQNANPNNNFNQYEFNRQSQNAMQVTSGGGWYFYNPSAISLGYSEFLSRWGNRKLEDNWRRKNKIDILEEEDTFGIDPEYEPSDKEKYDREYYIAQLPIEDDDRKRVLSKIESAYYNLAVVFKNEMQEYEEAISVYNQLLEIFPETDYRPLIYFDTYNIRLLQEDTISSNSIFEQIKLEYPESNYYQILLGVEKQDKVVDQDDEVYRLAYNLFSKHTQESCRELEDLIIINKGNDHLPQMELLGLFCKSESMNKREYILQLETIMKKHPKSNISNKIDSMLTSLLGETPDSISGGYLIDENAPHHFFVLMKDLKINLPEMQQSISSFNQTKYKLDSLTTSNLLLNKQEQLLKVGVFKNKEHAHVYYDLILTEESIKEKKLNNQIELFIISENNFKALVKEKDIKAYRLYFNQIYLLN